MIIHRYCRWLSLDQHSSLTRALGIPCERESTCDKARMQNARFTKTSQLLYMLLIAVPYVVIFRCCDHGRHRCTIISYPRTYCSSIRRPRLDRRWLSVCWNLFFVLTRLPCRIGWALFFAISLTDRYRAPSTVAAALKVSHMGRPIEAMVP